MKATTSGHASRVTSAGRTTRTVSPQTRSLVEQRSTSAESTRPLSAESSASKSSFEKLRELYPSDSEEEEIAEHSFSLTGLRRLKVLFDKYEEAGGMEIAEFIDEVGPLIPHFSRDDLELLFKRVDANANGSVDWDEISTYLLMNDVKSSIQHTVEARAKEFAAQPLQGMSTADHQIVRHLVHKKDVTRLVMHPKLPKYITGGLDGMVKMWSMDTLQHEKTLQVSRSPVTDVVCTDWNDLLAVTGMDGSVCFYNCDSGELVRAFVGQRRRMLVNSHGHVMPDDRRVFLSRPRFTVPLNRKDAEELRATGRMDILGKSETRIPILSHFETDQKYETTVLENLGFVRNGRRYDSLGFPTAIDLMHFGGSEKMFVGLQGGYVQVYDATMPSAFGNPLSSPCHHTLHIHWDQISKIKCVPHMDLLLTASYDGTVQVRNTDRIEDVGTVLGDGALPPLTDYMNIRSEGYYGLYDSLQRGHLRRITSMDWNSTFKMIATCAPEKDVLLWSPYIQKPITKLEGNKGRVIDLHFNQRDGQLLTLSDDKVIKLWDLRTYQCVQTLTDTFVDGAHPLLTAQYNPRKDCVVMGTSNVRAWPLLRNSEFHPGYFGHRRPVIAIAVSRLFAQVITADSRIIVVWDTVKQSVIMRWEVEEGINDICLDTKERRLLVGTEDGTIKVYNYVNGFLLKTCMPEEGTACPVNGVQFGEHTEPRETRVLISTYEPGFANIFMDDDGGEDAPHRVVQTGGPVYCSIVLPPSIVVFGIRGGVSSHNLEEISNRSQVFARKPTRMVPPIGIFEGPLTPDWMPNVTGVERDDQIFGAGLGEGTPFEDDQTSSYAITECVLGLIGDGVHDPVTVVSGTGDGMLQFWDLHSQVEIFRFRASNVRGDGINCMDKSTDESRLFVGDYGGYVKVFNIAGIRKHELNCSGGSKPNKNTPLVITSEMIHLHKMWRAHGGPLFSVRYVPDVNFVACSSSDCAVSLWDADRGIPVMHLGEDRNDIKGIRSRARLPHSQQTLAVLDELRIGEVAQLIALFDDGLTWREILQYFSPAAVDTTSTAPGSPTTAASSARMLDISGVSRMEQSSYVADATPLVSKQREQPGQHDETASLLTPHGGCDHPAFQPFPLNTDDSSVIAILQRVIGVMVDPPPGREPLLAYSEDTARYRVIVALRKIRGAQARRAAAALTVSIANNAAGITSPSAFGTAPRIGSADDVVHRISIADVAASPSSLEALPTIIFAPVTPVQGSASTATNDFFTDAVPESAKPQPTARRTTPAAVAEDSVARSTTMTFFPVLNTGDDDSGGSDADEFNIDGNERPIDVLRAPMHVASLRTPRIPTTTTSRPPERQMRLHGLPSQLTGAHSVRLRRENRGEIVRTTLAPSDGEPLVLHNKTPELGLTAEQLAELERQHRKRQAVVTVMRWKPPVVDEGSIHEVIRRSRCAIERLENFDAQLRFSLYREDDANAGTMTGSGASFTPGPSTDQDAAPSVSRRESLRSELHRTQESQAARSGGGASPTQWSVSDRENATPRPRQARHSGNASNRARAMTATPSSAVTIPEVDVALAQAMSLRREQLDSARSGNRPSWDAADVLSKNIGNKKGGYIIVGDDEQRRLREHQASKMALRHPRPPGGGSRLGLTMLGEPAKVRDELAAHRLSSMHRRISNLSVATGSHTPTASSSVHLAVSSTPAPLDASVVQSQPVTTGLGSGGGAAAPAAENAQPSPRLGHTSPTAALQENIETLLHSPLRDLLPSTRNPPKPVPTWISRIHTEIVLGDHAILSRLDQPLHQEVIRKQMELVKATETEGSWVKELSTMRGIKSEWYLSHKSPATQTARGSGASKRQSMVPPHGSQQQPAPPHSARR